jgi:hypothetical protein
MPVYAPSDGCLASLGIDTTIHHYSLLAHHSATYSLSPKVCSSCQLKNGSTECCLIRCSQLRGTFTNIQRKRQEVRVAHSLKKFTNHLAVHFSRRCMSPSAWGRGHKQRTVGSTTPLQDPWEDGSIVQQTTGDWMAALWCPKKKSRYQIFICPAQRLHVARLGCMHVEFETISVV